MARKVGEAYILIKGNDSAWLADVAKARKTWLKDAKKDAGQFSKSWGDGMKGVHPHIEQLKKKMRSLSKDFSDDNLHMARSTDVLQDALNDLGKNDSFNKFSRSVKKSQTDIDRSVRRSESSSKRLSKTWGKSAGKIRGAWSRMDRTVKLVLGLLVTGGDQIATLGSGIASTFTALAGTAGYALMSIVPAAGGAAAGLLGVSLAVASLNDLSKDATDALGRLKKSFSDVQGKKFADEWSASLASFGNTLADIVGKSDIGEAFGKSFASITKNLEMAAKSPAFSALVKAFETTLPAALSTAGQGLSNFIQGISSVLAAAAPATQDLADMFAGWASGWAGAMESMRKDGSLEDFFGKAVDALEALLDVVGPLGSALGNVFAAGYDSGMGMLKTLGDLTSKFDEWTSSIAGQNSLAEWFANGREIMGSMEPLLAGLAQGLNNLVTPDSIKRFSDLMSSLGELMPVLGTALNTIGKLGVFNIFADALNAVGQAIQPLLGPLGEIASIIGGRARDAIAAISPILDAFGQAFAPILDAVKPLIAVFGGVWINLLKSVASAVAPVVSALGEKLAPVFARVAEAVAPVIATLGDAFSQIFPKLIEVITPVINIIGDQLAPLFATLVEMIAPVVSQVIDMLLPAFLSLMDALSPLISAIAEALVPAFQSILEALQPLIDAFMSLLIPVFNTLMTILQPVIEVIVSMLIPAFQLVASIITSVVVAAIDNVTGVLEGLKKFFTGLVKTVTSLFKGDWKAAWDGAKEMVSGAVQAIWNFIQLWLLGKAVKLVKNAGKLILDGIKSAWTKAKGAVTDAVSAIKEAIQTGFNKAKSIVKDAVTALKNSVKNAFDSIVDLLGSWKSKFLNFIRTAWSSAKSTAKEFGSNLLSTIKNAFSKVVSAAKEIPGKIKSALSDLLAKGTQAGKDLINGLVNAIAGGATAIWNALKNVVSNAWDSVLGFLGIHSPSKKMQWVGEMMIAGLIKPMHDSLSTVRNSAAGMARAALDGVNSDSLFDQGRRAGEGLMQGLGSSTRGGVDVGVSGLDSGAGRGGIYVAPGAIVINSNARSTVNAAEQMLDGLARGLVGEV